MTGCATLLCLLIVRGIAIERSLGVLFLGTYVSYVWIIY